MAAAQYWQENTFWMQVELSQEMINLKQAEAEKRRSAVQKNSFGQNCMKPSSCCCCSLSSSFSSWPREQKVLAHQAQPGCEVPRALVASTRWLFFIHTGIWSMMTVIYPVFNVVVFTKRPSFIASIFAGAYRVSNRGTRRKLFRRDTCHLSRVHWRPTR